MNIFNRVVMVLLILLLIGLIVFFLVRPVEVVVLLAGAVAMLQERIFDGTFWLYLVIGSVIAIALLVLLLFLEVRRPKLRVARVQGTGNSDTWMSIQSISKSLEYRIDELPNVRTVRPRVRSRGKDVEVAVELDVSPGANIVSITDQVAKIATDIIETQLGLKIRNKVAIKVTQAPYPKGPAAAVASVAVTPPSEVPPSAPPEPPADPTV